MKKIAFVYHSLAGGGAEKELLAYVTHLNKDDYEVHFLLTRMEGELLSTAPSSIHFHEVPGDSNSPSLRHLLRLSYCLWQIKPTIVIGCMQDIHFNILVVRLITRLQTKIILSEQVVLSEWQKVKKTPYVKKMLIKYLYKLADAYFVQSESIRDDLHRYIGVDSNKIFLLPSFVQPNEFSGHTHRNKKTVRQPYFLYVGRLDPEKNIGLLLRAFHTLWQNNHRIRLIILGTHKNTEYDKLCQLLNITSAVEFKGFIPDPYHYYDKAIALIIPSFVEGRSRVMIEAMLSGCPVITSDFIGHERYITNNVTGFVFRRDSEAELTKLMEFSIRSPRALQTIAKKAKTFITKTHINIHFRLYKKTLAEALMRIE